MKSLVVDVLSEHCKQDVSFNTGAQIDDKAPKRLHTRCQNPPGGKSSALW